MIMVHLSDYLVRFALNSVVWLREGNPADFRDAKVQVLVSAIALNLLMS